MAAAPSQRRGMPQPYDSRGAQMPVSNVTGAYNAPHPTSSVMPGGSQQRQQQQQQQQPISSSSTHWVAQPSGTAPAPHAWQTEAYPRQQQQIQQHGSGYHTEGGRIGNEEDYRGAASMPAHSGYFPGTALYAAPAIPTFPWSTAPPSTQRRGSSAAELMAADLSGYVDLSATPEKQRRGRIGSMDGLSGKDNYDGPMVRTAGHFAKPGDSSLVFALREDNELKVLASRVGTAAGPTNQAKVSVVSVAQTTAAAGDRTVSGSSMRHNTANGPANHTTISSSGDSSQRQQHNGGGGRGDATGVGVAIATTSSEQQQHQGRPYVSVESVNIAATTRTDRSSTSISSSGGGGGGGGGAAESSGLNYPPQLSAVHPPSSAAATVATAQPALHVPTLGKTPSQPYARTGSAPPQYRSSPHELRSPPPLHVCPGGIPGRNTSGGGGHDGPWSMAPAPSVSLYPSVYPPNTAVNALSATARSDGATGMTSRASTSGAPSAAPEGGSAGGGGELNRNHFSSHPTPVPSRHVHRRHPSSMDGRSMQSSTPPPPPHNLAAPPPAAAAASVSVPQPVPKNFTRAQLAEAHAAVKEELFVNYTAIPIPSEMVNTGDTDERRRRLDQRQKQILYGKETDGYAKYTTLIPQVCDREYHNPLHALTPRPEYDCSKRQFDRVLNAWRRQLHLWDACDLTNLDPDFCPLGTATLLDLGLAGPTPPVTTSPPPLSSSAGVAASSASIVTAGPVRRTPTAVGKPPLQPAAVMHSIANVAAMAHDHRGAGPQTTTSGNKESNSHSTTNSHYIGNGNSGAAASSTPINTGSTVTGGGVGDGQAKVCDAVPASGGGVNGAHSASPRNMDSGEDDGAASHSRSPVFTDGANHTALYVPIRSGCTSTVTAAACTPSRPQLSESAEGPHVDESFFHMSSSSSRIASPFYPSYAATGAGGPNNGRNSANPCYQALMRHNAYAHTHHGGTPGNNGPMHTGLTPAHRPPSRGTLPHHMAAIFGREYELMTPSGPGSPSGVSHTQRSGGSPYRMEEPWGANRRSPTYAAGVAAVHGVAPPHHHGAPLMRGESGGGNHSNGGNGGAGVSSIAAANSCGTMVLTGARGESPPQITELSLIPGPSSMSGNGGFAQSPYEYRVHSPEQSQQQQQSPTALYGTPLAHQHSPSRSPIGLPQQGRVAIATTVSVSGRSRKGSGLGSGTLTWTPPNPHVQMRRSPQTPQLHLSSTPPSHGKQQEQ